jgi:hypothetical protein
VDVSDAKQRFGGKQSAGFKPYSSSGAGQKPTGISGSGHTPPGHTSPGDSGKGTVKALAGNAGYNPSGTAIAAHAGIPGTHVQVMDQPRMPEQTRLPEQTRMVDQGQSEQSELIKIAEARFKGYEGDPCPTCGSFTLLRNGTCMKCNTCGGTTGCS